MESVIETDEYVGPTETKYHWSELPLDKQNLVVRVHLQAWRKAGIITTFSHFRRLFNLGNPFIVWGEHEDRSAYCRIAEESIDVMKVITREYING